MEQITLNNICVTTWLISNPKAIVVISHGMAEHVERYDDFANALNKNGYSVYGIHQIGHGRMIKNELKGHFEYNDFFHCADNLNELITNIKENNPNKKVYLFGHSMGSFISQYYISTYHNIDGVILCGSNGPNAFYKVQKVLANIIYMFANNKSKAYFLNNMAFSPFNKKFKPNRTNVDWLSRDNNEVDKYVKDELCGFVPTVGFFKEFLKGLSSLKEKQNNIPLSLPVFIISGDKDPVGLMGKGVARLYNQYKLIAIQDLEMKLYDGGRHEILNETNKEEVKTDVINWLNKRAEYEQK